jgi:glutathione S-transferase
LDALELLLVAGRGSTSFCVGNEVSLADIVLVPQMYHARKFKLAVDDFPRL